MGTIDKIGRVLHWLNGLPARRMTRRGLMELTDDQLRDIGLSRADAARGGLRRPWW